MKQSVSFSMILIGAVLTGCTVHFRRSDLDSTLLHQGSLSLGTVPSLLRGGETLSLHLTAPEVSFGKKVTSLELAFAQDGETYASPVSLTPGNQVYPWIAPSVDVTSARLKLTATDETGASFSEESAPFQIDSTAPTTPALTLFSSALTNSRSAKLTVDGCTDRSAIWIGDATDPAPTLSTSGWVPCSAVAGDLVYSLPAGDGTTSLAAWARDAAGNLSNESSSVAVTLDQTAPGAPGVTFASNSLTALLGNSATQTFTVSDCTDRAKILFTETTTTPLATDPDWQTCSTAAGAFSYVFLGDGTHPLKVWAMDGAGNLSPATSLTYEYDSTPPTLTSLVINNGAMYTGTPLVNVKLNVTEIHDPISIRLSMADPVTGDCQSEYADDSWQSYAASGTPQTYSFLVTAGDGTKTICAWAKDSTGNVSTISPSTGTQGVDQNSIQFSIGNPPQIAAFTAVNDTPGGNYGTTVFLAGDTIKIAWTATDTEGLDDHPISLSYSTDNVHWLDVVTNGDITDSSNMTWLGSLSGNPTSDSDSYTSFQAPTVNYLRLKIMVKDEAGNIGISVLSDTLNTPGWSIYAGSVDRGIGGTALSASFQDGARGWGLFDVHPTTNDLYVIDSGYGIRKVDATTGLVSTFLQHGTTNLPTDGYLSASSRLNTTYSILAFDHRGYLYVLDMDSSTYLNSSTLYQIDPVTGHCRLYVGGGTAIDNTATPSTAFVLKGPFTFDEDNSIYFLANCNPGTWGTGNHPMRLMKMTQNTDGTAGTVSVVAGDCTNANPSTSDVDALTAPFATGNYGALAGLSAWNHGQTIYYAVYPSTFRKILNGKNDSASITASGYQMAYSSWNGKLYASAAGEIREYTPSLTGAGGETYTSFVTSNGTGNCTADGVDAASACVNAQTTFVMSPQGTLLFGDGPAVNSPRKYRVRYRDTSGKVRTLAGSLPFIGDGLDKSVINGVLSGIYYKQATEPNQTAFPAGLYFTEQQGLVMGYIDPSTEKASILAGTQQGNSIPLYSDGTSFDTDLDLGGYYSGGNLFALNFDGDGLPWFRYQNALTSVDSSHKIVARQTVSSSNFWNLAADGTDPSTVDLYVYGTSQNLTFKDHGVFLMGSYRSLPSYDEPPQISFLDFDHHTMRKIMGNSSSGSSADDATPGDPVNLSLDLSCANQGPCYLQYRSDEDRLYFGELTKIRYLTTPTDTANSTLGTLFTQPNGYNIYNFIFHPGNDQVFYMASDGKLHCHDISSGKSWCDDSALGPASGMSGIGRGPNQFTWRDSSHLLISTYSGYIYEYTLSP